MDKKRLSIIIFIIGLTALVLSGIFFIFTKNQAPKITDAEFLVSTGSWSMNDGDGVIWQFTEIGKGRLTTNNHLNTYDFIWALDGDTLKIETDWAYKLENTYTYKLDQTTKILELKSNDKIITFAPTPKTAETPTEAPTATPESNPSPTAE